MGCGTFGGNQKDTKDFDSVKVTVKSKPVSKNQELLLLISVENQLDSPIMVEGSSWFFEAIEFRELGSSIPNLSLDIGFDPSADTGGQFSNWKEVPSGKSLNKTVRIAHDPDVGTLFDPVTTIQLVEVENLETLQCRFEINFIKIDNGGKRSSFSRSSNLV